MSIEMDIARVNKKLEQLARGLKEEIQENKKLKEQAAAFVIPIMKEKAPIAEKTVKRFGKTIKPGSLKKSISFLNLRRSQDAFVGPKAKVAPHAHLAEYGFVHHISKRFVPGAHFVKQTFEATKERILRNLVIAAKFRFESLGQKLSE